MSRTAVFLVAVQAFTMVCLGVIFLRRGDWRLGVAQLLLAAVTWVIYSGGS